jgi:hypothetical protein
VAHPARLRRNPIDAFVHQKLAALGLSPAPEADRRTLIRRLSFDLTGLPPSIEEVEAFVADPDELAYEKLVDRLLASPRFGERWARLWLDLVHYGETHGYDKDKPRPNAWPYRDYVIRAANEDRPFGRFIEEQVAGDVLYPGTRDGIEALGFLAAGPWDFIGHAEVPETKIDGKIARHLDRDDMVASTMQTFNSLTVQCAQCHDHKFDPIPQEDYYRLQAVFAAIDRTDRTYDADPEIARRRGELSASQGALAAKRKALDEALASRAGPKLRELDQQIAAASKSSRREDAFGYHSNIEAKPDAVKWVQVDLGQSVALASVTLHPCRDDFNNIGEGFGFPVRFKVELASDADFTRDVAVVADLTGADVPNPRLAAQTFEAGGRAARFVRVTATRLALRQNDYIFAISELKALTASGTNAALGAAVASLDSIEAPVRWQRTNLTDGYFPGGSAADSPDLARLRAERQALLDGAVTAGEKAARAELDRDLASVQAALAALPPPGTCYVGAVHSGAGAFLGTGASGGKPRPIHVLARGDVLKPGKEVEPGALGAVTVLPARFALPAGHAEGERRAALARWLSDRQNPLTWRSIANRLWQQCFGRGLVDTPNDFGRMGSAPTHPGLLDWLAVEMRDGGQSPKALIRLLVTSATYRQTSLASVAAEQAAGAVDADNRYLWRMSRRKLEAEAVRDSILLLAGVLDLRMGGPSFQDFVIDKPEHSPHYEYHLHDPEDPLSHRRSIYRFIVRSQQQPFLTTLDCADPSMQVGKRNESVSTLQALALLNNSLVLAMAKRFAARLESLSGGLEARVEAAHREALGRPPSPEALAALVAHAREHGLANFCRVLLNLNEFAFVD